MRRLTCIREREQGAIAAIVAVLFGGGVMLGLAALTVDVGNINADRRQLQNGADAVALAVAQQCAKDVTCDITGTNLDKLQKLVDANAADRATSIRRVDGAIGTDLVGKPAICGNLPGLSACPDAWIPSKSTSLPNLQECPSPPASGAKYVRVYTETKSSNGQNLLPYYFGAAITGISGANQQTCASVGIESLGRSYEALPIVIALCAYDSMLEKNPITPANPQGPFPPMPPIPGASQTAPVPMFPTTGGSPSGSVDYSKYVTTIFSHVTDNKEPVVGPVKCGATNSGKYLPGGFGWTATTNDQHCATNFNSDIGTVPISTGASVPNGCRNGGTSPITQVGTTVYVPIMTDISADGNSYIIDGLAGFYLAGYSAPSAGSWDGYQSNAAFTIPDFKGGNDGFWGWFTDKFVPTGESGGTGTHRGPTTLVNIG